MSQFSGALPGTIQTASLKLQLTALGAGVSGIATVSLADLKYNEASDQSAFFSMCQLRVARQGDVLVELLPMGDVLEVWPRHTILREIMMRVTNISNAALTLAVPLLLMGYPPAPVPKAGNFTRLVAPALLNTGPPVEAFDTAGLPLVCKWLVLAAAAGGSGSLGADDGTAIPIDANPTPSQESETSG